MIDLSSLRPGKGAVKSKKRVGRGPGSGHGKTSCRGHKGQKARTGGAKPVWFEGGQMPLYKRLPKRGFKNPFRVEYQIVNLDILDKYFENGEVVNRDTLLSKGLIKDPNMPVKILGRGEIT
ncbi:MAG: 50S ribosomal protein L15, partial [candidate division WOR-3 bacterium]